jgi:predicted TIM-barrel enzyme
MIYPSEMLLGRCLEIANFDLGCPLQTIVSRHPGDGETLAVLLTQLAERKCDCLHPISPEKLQPTTLREIAPAMLKFQGAHVNDSEIEWYGPDAAASRSPSPENLKLRELLGNVEANNPERLCPLVRQSQRNSLADTAFRRCFRNRHVVLPVIHVVAEAQALRNAAIARDAGADGVFLINHSIPWEELLKIHYAVVSSFSDWWVGVNLLDVQPAAVFWQIDSKVAGVWVDNAMIQEKRLGQPEAQMVLESQRSMRYEGLYFGGVAFKYQRPVADLRRAVATARDFMSVVTTSGPGTGLAAHVDKIRIMKEALGDFPLAIASGITPENIAEYLPYSDCYLVATGISDSFDELNPKLTRRLIAKVRAYDEAKP